MRSPLVLGLLAAAGCARHDAAAPASVTRRRLARAGEAESRRAPGRSSEGRPPFFVPREIL